MNQHSMPLSIGSFDNYLVRDEEVLRIRPSAPDEPMVHWSMHQMNFVQRLVFNAKSDQMIQRRLRENHRFTVCFLQHFSNG
jgi:hypothetical protein